jgi:hypothetical protein
MARPRKTHPKTNAERQAEYRERKKAAGLKRKDDWINPLVASKGKPTQEQIERKKQWDRELQEEELKAARKAGREREQNKYYRRGHVAAIVSVCGFFIRKDRRDIAQALLKNYDIDLAKCKENQVNSLDLTVLEKVHIFDEPVATGKASVF